MRSLTISDIKRRGSKAISDEEVSYLIVNSRPKSAIVPIEEYEAMIEALDELGDIKAIEERRGEPTIPWKDIKRELDL